MGGKRARSFKIAVRDGVAGAEGFGLGCRLGQRFCACGAKVATGDPRPSARGFGAAKKSI